MLIYLQMIDGPADKRTFERVYAQYHRLMFQVAWDILRNQRDAEDAVHDAFVAIAKNISKISDPVCNKTQGYVVTIVRNRAIDLYRAKRRRPAEALDETAGAWFDAPQGGLAAAMARLPDRDREFLLLKYGMGYTDRELAAHFRLSYAGARSLDARAKRKLKDALEEEGIEV